MGDVMCGIAAANYHGPFSCRVLARAREFGRVAEHAPLESLRALENGLALHPRGTRGLDDVSRTKLSRLRCPVSELACDSHCPAALFLIPLAACKLCIHPDVELHQLCVRRQELGQLVFRGKDGPLRWEIEIWQVVVPYGVVKDKLAISLAPVIAHTLISVYE